MTQQNYLWRNQEVIVLDFETYFDKEYTLSKMSTPEYLADPRFEILSVTIARYREGAWSTGYYPAPDVEVVLDTFDWQKTWVVCHNAYFDVAILRKLGHNPSFILDTIALASHVCAKGAHGLKNLADERGWAPKGDTKQFLGLHWAKMSDEEKEALKEYNLHDVKLTVDLFVELIQKVAPADRELPIINHTIQLSFRQSIFLDAEKATKILQSLQTKMAEAIEATGHTRSELNGEAFTQILAAQAGAVPLKQGKRKMTLALSKKDPERSVWEKHSDPKVRALIYARNLGKSLPLHIGRAKKLLAYAQARGGVLGFPVRYYAACTGRFGGTGGINLQNLSARGDGDINELRKALIPPPGKEFRVYDYAQIEARGVAWLADCSFALEAFSQGRDIYSELASNVYGCKVWKPSKSDPPDVAKKVGLMRQVGKAGILGSGYGLSPAGMRNYLMRENIIGMDDKSELEVKLVNTYRKTYPQIPQLWDNLMTIAWTAVKYRTKFETQHLTFDGTQGWTFILTLPSGRPLYFYNPLAIKDAKGIAIDHEHGRIWKGLITENIVQGFCRDILVDKILACEAAGYPVAYHIHDSIGFVVEKGLTSMPEVDTILVEPLAWCEGMPLSVEATQSPYFD